VLLLPLSLFSSTVETARTIDSSAYAPLSVTLLTSICAQIALLFTLYFSESSATTSSTLFPRNLINLVSSTFGREGMPLRENWMQVVLVYGIGSAAVLWTDAVVSGAVKDLKNGNEGGNFLPLGGSSSPNIPTLHPPSPPANFRKPSDHSLQQASSRLPSILTLIPFLPLLIYLITSPATTSSLSSACLYLPPSLRANVCPTANSTPKSRTVDVVMRFVTSLPPPFRPPA
jgi:hypothetical protein